MTLHSLAILDVLARHSSSCPLSTCCPTAAAAAFLCRRPMPSAPELVRARPACWGVRSRGAMRIRLFNTPAASQHRQRCQLLATKAVGKKGKPCWRGVGGITSACIALKHPISVQFRTTLHLQAARQHCRSWTSDAGRPQRCLSGLCTRPGNSHCEGSIQAPGSPACPQPAPPELLAAIAAPALHSGCGGHGGRSNGGQGRRQPHGGAAATGQVGHFGRLTHACASHRVARSMLPDQWPHQLARPPACRPPAPPGRLPPPAILLLLDTPGLLALLCDS